MHSIFRRGLGLIGFEDGAQMTSKRKPLSPGKPDEKSLDRRLAAARKAAEDPRPRSMIERSAFGIAARLVAELVSGLVVGGGIGWLIDRLFDTSPVFLVVFFILGATAGIMNVFRAAKQMNAARAEAQEDNDEGSARD